MATYIKPDAVKDSSIAKRKLDTALKTEIDGKQDIIPDLDTIRAGAALGASSLQKETDPSVPSWAKAATKPSYTPAEIGAASEDSLQSHENDNTRHITEIERTEWNAKQEALTLTVKDNGNIVLANIQGQSKEFMPATPSGDPMHYAYITAGAEYNNTGADIVKDAPWADMVDDDYTGDYGKTVVHKAGYWYLNGLGNLTNEDMQIAYSWGNILLRTKFAQLFRINQKLKTNICFAGQFYSNGLIISDSSYMIYNSSVKVLLLVPIEYINVSSQYIRGNYQAAFYGSGNLIAVLGNINPNNTKNFISYAINLRYIKIIKLSTAIDFKEAPNLSIKSVLYMINNEAATSPIAITLHADVYNRCRANADIVAALQAHPNVSLASA